MEAEAIGMDFMVSYVRTGSDIEAYNYYGEIEKRVSSGKNTPRGQN